MKNLYIFMTLVMMPFLAPLTSNAQYTEHWESGFAARYRVMNKVTINDNNRYFAVGGWEENDAISTIYISDDTCKTWIFKLDVVNAWLQDISFPTTNTGYVVGHAGSIYKSTNEGDSWDLLSLTGNAAGRNYNGVHFFNDQEGIVVGGNQSNDAIQTILKTTDGGANWSVISDNMGPWLRDVYFVDESIGYACGDAGIVLKTTDAGDSWETLATPNNIQNRQLNSIFFVNADLGYVVGGNPANDSIQSIIKTTDGGNSWSIIKDEMGNMLNGVFALNSSEVHAVGNWGEMLFSSDQGENWELLDTGVNDTVNLYDIYFKNSIQGIAGGYIGKYFSYFDLSGNQPDLYIDSPVFVLSPNSVRIEGAINPNSKPTSLKFEYGLTSEFGQIINVSSDSIIGDEIQEVAFNLYNLEEHMMYYGRLKATNIYGTTYSETITFFIGVNYIPNFSFENWSENVKEVLSDWKNEGDIHEVESYDGSKAAYISGENDDLGVIYFGDAGDDGLFGGIEYNERPDTISFWAKYDIADLDTALVIFHLKENGEEFIAEHIFKISGTSNNEFVQLKFKIDYINDHTPEVLFFGFLSTNAFAEVNTESALTVDDLCFHSVDSQLPNADMESWEEEVEYNVDEWISKDDMDDDDEKMVTQYEDAYSGNLALKLSNIITDDYKQFAYLNSGNNLYDRAPSFPVSYKHETLYGYFQFFPQDNDTLFIDVEFYFEGEQVGYGRKTISETVDSYTLFELSINYYNEVMPDSASIYVSIQKENYEGIPASSYAIIDNFSFDAIISPQSITSPTIKNAAELLVYPNPASDYLNIELNSQDKNINGDLYLLDMQGRIYTQQRISISSNDRYTLDLSDYPPQVYILIIQTNTNRYTKKIILK